jgi:uncharacterized damage-inducible protein DinB
MAQRPSHLHILVSHEHWANHRLVDALREAGAFDESVCRLMDHLLAAHDTWLARITGRDATMQLWNSGQNPAHYPHHIDHFFQQWKKALSFDEPERLVHYSNSKGTSFSQTVGEIMLHLAMHGQYHRGQIIQIAKPRLDTPPALDLIVFLRESSPAL